MNLFDVVVPDDKQHPVFKHCLQNVYDSERNLLNDWADAFPDRDGKFVQEFQKSFEPCLWELYLFALLKDIPREVSFDHPSPDFHVSGTYDFCMEATIAAPTQDGDKPHGFDSCSIPDVPNDFDQFNAESTIRICNSFSSKEKKYRSSYSSLSHVIDKPFVIAIGSFDRPHSTFSGDRHAMAALYGIYFDEKSNSLIDVDSVRKQNGAKVPLGLFRTNDFSHISAVVYSSVATWGKVRVLAKNPKAPAYVNTFHADHKNSIVTEQQIMAQNSIETVSDGLCIFHNPYADKPLHLGAFYNERVMQWYENSIGKLVCDGPKDFLLTRKLIGMAPIEN